MDHDQDQRRNVPDKQAKAPRLLKTDRERLGPSQQQGATTTEFKRPAQADCVDIISLMNNPLVRRQIPLTKDDFDEADCRSFVTTKAQLWHQHGFGP